MERQKLALSAVLFQTQEPGKEVIIVDGQAIELKNFELTRELIQIIQKIADFEQATDDVNEEKIVEAIKAAIAEAEEKAVKGKSTRVSEMEI